ncbi:TatD family hydrolase [Puniceicoccaceae bacterium K14]|nr:TatD family hydrolase [Puniceicoccaceae bacterium K14]
MQLFDAHCHLQDVRLLNVQSSLNDNYGKLFVESVIVNGTSEGDWDQVKQISEKLGQVIPAYGLHPWNIGGRSTDWKQRLLELWQDPHSQVGEIGLDRWVADYDTDDQLEVFLWQFREGLKRAKPITIHCLKAWGLLYDTLRSERPFQGRFLLHSYGGPKEMVEPFAKMGAYFSISGYFALDRKRVQQEVFRQVPIERLLVETDAPDMMGPNSVIESPLIHKGVTINHPANIRPIYEFAARLRGMEVTSFTEVVAENFRRFVVG